MCDSNSSQSIARRNERKERRTPCQEQRPQLPGHSPVQLHRHALTCHSKPFPVGRGKAAGRSPDALTKAFTGWVGTFRRQPGRSAEAVSGLLLKQEVGAERAGPPSRFWGCHGKEPTGPCKPGGPEFAEATPRLILRDRKSNKYWPEKKRWVEFMG